MNELKELYNLCQSINCTAIYDEPLCRHTSFKIGGPADLFININDMQTLCTVLKYINTNNVPFFVIGNGSNLLVSDDGFRGVVLRLTGNFLNMSIIDTDNCIIKCGGGTKLIKLCLFAMNNSFKGLEFAFGIPGSCGGALYMNAGAYGYEMSSVVQSCEYITPSANICKVDNSEMNLQYRCSMFSDSDNVITSITFKLQHGNKSTIKSEMDNYMLMRKTKQPLEFPSAGSIFKRPEGAFAGTLIEQCGLKGCRVGDAMVSEKHAGFIINTGNAKCNDVLKLISIIKERVFVSTGFDLKCEVKTLGVF